MNKMYQFKSKQTGATLAVGLILLLVMTLIGVTALKTTALQEKMSGSLHNKVLAQGGAESALREAESYLWNYFATSNGLALSSSVGANHGFLDPTTKYSLMASFRDMSTDDWLAIGKGHDHDFTTDGAASLKNLPRYYIDEITNSLAGLAEFGTDGYEGSAGILKKYVITARADSGDGKINELVESVFSTRTK